MIIKKNNILIMKENIGSYVMETFSLNINLLINNAKRDGLNKQKSHFSVVYITVLYI